MYSKILAFLIVVVVLVGVAAGCGGGGQQDAQSQGSEKKEQAGDGKAGEGGTKTESLSGRVVRVNPDKDSMVVNPKEGKPLAVRYRSENLEVTLDGEQAQPEDIEKGQAASVEYVTHTTKKDREVNVARSIELKSKGGGKTGGETTG